MFDEQLVKHIIHLILIRIQYQFWKEKKVHLNLLLEMELNWWNW